jgi:hypothetical protein
MRTILLSLWKMSWRKQKNLKLLLCTFEQLSGLKINFHNSEFFCFGEAQISKNLYSHLFRCQVGKYLFKYLGIPMHYKRIKNVDWKELEQRMEKT